MDPELSECLTRLNELFRNKQDTLRGAKTASRASPPREGVTYEPRHITNSCSQYATVTISLLQSMQYIGMNATDQRTTQNCCALDRSNPSATSCSPIPRLLAEFDR
jgi:hypothetical protein